MDARKIKLLFSDVSKGKISVDTALNTLKNLPYEDIDFAKIDHHRGLRNGIPEVIFAQNKKTNDIVAIARSMLKKSGRFLITRASEKVYKASLLQKY